MKNEELEGQINWFSQMEMEDPGSDQDTQSTKMYREPSVPTTEKTGRRSSRKASGSSSRKLPLFLYLKGDGPQKEWHMGTDGPLPTAFMMRNTSEFHKGGNGYPLLWTIKGTLPVRSCLTSILERSADPKYNLSAKACQGILNRAERRGKELPEILKAALLRQATSDGSVGGERIETDS